MTTSRRQPALDKSHRQTSWLLASERIFELYHFTAIGNLRHIFKTGALLCRAKLSSKRGVGSVVFGGDELSRRIDDKRGNSSYVSLSFKPRTPMANRNEQCHQMCYLVFDSRVALRSGVLFVNGNAASDEAIQMAGFSGLREVDFEALATRSARRGSPTYNDKQAELLVPARVSLDDLEYVAFRSQASLDEAVRCCAGVGRRHPFRVQPDLFHFPNGKGNHFGSISAELINRHRYSSGSSRLLTEEQLFSVLAGPGLKGGIAKLERGISLVQTIATLKHVTMTVKWTGPTPGKRIVISGLSTAHLPFLDKSISAVCTSLGPELLVPGQWKVKCTLTLDDISKQIPIDQFTIPFTIQ